MKYLSCLLILVSSISWSKNPSLGDRLLGKVGVLLNNEHYSHIPIDDALSERLLAAHLNHLDPSHDIFLKEDVDRFHLIYGHYLDDQIRDGDSSAAVEIYSQFKIRSKEFFLDMIHSLEIQHDFNLKESLFYRDNKSKWLLSKSERSELTRLYAKALLLEAKLSGKDPTSEAKNRILRFKRRIKAVDAESDSEAVSRFLSSFVSLFDPHSDYMGPADTEEFKQILGARTFGIGASFRMTEAYPEITMIRPGAPADKKLNIKDQIIAVDEGESPPVDLLGMSIDEIIALVRGPENTEVRLTIRPSTANDPSERKIVSIMRKEISLEEERAALEIHERIDFFGKKIRVAIIKVPGFYDDENAPLGARVDEDVKAILKRIEKEYVDGVVLDLRDNPGGSLPAAISLAGLFVKFAAVAQIKSSQGQRDILFDIDPAQQFTGPLLVMVNKRSASASELTAAALQDLGRAVIVGDKSTYGKGTAQQLIDLNEFVDSSEGKAGTLKITERKFYRISGVSTQKTGVSSDIVLPSLLDLSKNGEDSFDNALDVDTIEPLPFSKGEITPQIISSLRSQSEKRISNDKDFSYVKEDIERFRQLEETKEISLNEVQRKTEIAERKLLETRRGQEMNGQRRRDEVIFRLNIKEVQAGAALMPVTNTNRPNEKSSYDFALEAQTNEALNILEDEIVELKKASQ